MSKVNDGCNDRFGDQERKSPEKAYRRKATARTSSESVVPIPPCQIYVGHKEYLHDACGVMFLLFRRKSRHGM